MLRIARPATYCHAANCRVTSEVAALISYSGTFWMHCSDPFNDDPNFQDYILSVINHWMSMDHTWNDADSKSEVFRKSPHQCQALLQKLRHQLIGQLRTWITWAPHNEPSTRWTQGLVGSVECLEIIFFTGNQLSDRPPRQLVVRSPGYKDKHGERLCH